MKDVFFLGIFSLDVNLKYSCKVNFEISLIYLYKENGNI